MYWTLRDVATVAVLPTDPRILKLSLVCSLREYEKFTHCQKAEFTRYVSRLLSVELHSGKIRDRVDISLLCVKTYGQTLLPVKSVSTEMAPT